MNPFYRDQQVQTEDEEDVSNATSLSHVLKEFDELRGGLLQIRQDISSLLNILSYSS
jgi:hypothetical protein